MPFLDRINQIICRGLLFFAGLALVSMVLLVFVNIVLRQFEASLTGVPEIVGWLTAVIIGFSLAHAQRTGAHIDLDVATNHLPMRVQQLLLLLVSLLSLAFFTMVSWKLYEYGMAIGRRGAVSQTLRFAYHPFILAVALGMAAFCLVLLNDALRHLLALFRPLEQQSDQPS
ncbi:MAG: TRAP transporter small permease [Saccharospirillum sp.]|nr:TRAP transporter small permease [Saccharospirillum sp.]